LSSTLADLEIATFAVDEIVEGTQTGRDAHTLLVARSQLAVGAGEPALAEATVEVVRPGDPVRLSNVLDAVLPDVRVDDPSATFPGVIGRADAPMVGRVHRLLGVAVLAVCDWGSAGYDEAVELPDSLVDMAGPGADRSPWGSTVNVVVRCVANPDAPVGEADAAVRRVAMGVARDLAAITRGEEPDDLETIGATSAPTTADLPAVVLILQVASEGPLVDTFLRGTHLRDFRPYELDPRELVGGALTNGAYDWAAVRNVTAGYQGPALLRELRAAHGERLRFAGVVLTPGYLDGADQKRRAAEGAADRARQMGADAVVCTTFSSGNSHTDTMLTVQACEARDIGCVALVAETNGGLTDHVPEADCLVSTGNEDELVGPWSPDRVVGGWERAHVGAPVPTVLYLGACSQMGDARWTARPA
jgi:glycine reductase complex component B subunit alpha and beta